MSDRLRDLLLWSLLLLAGWGLYERGYAVGAADGVAECEIAYKA